MAAIESCAVFGTRPIEPVGFGAGCVGVAELAGATVAEGGALGGAGATAAAGVL
ncbi:MAG: hypothetical protein MUF34_17310 [Polyangiaceae bacterium]|jgi:hypothetical protein|nr:hypothetical protein [Polyangiaceae bacterium]